MLRRRVNEVAKLQHRDAVDEGLRLLAAAADREQPGPYLLQAEIAACHASAARPEDTD